MCGDPPFAVTRKLTSRAGWGNTEAEGIPDSEPSEQHSMAMGN